MTRSRTTRSSTRVLFVSPRFNDKSFWRMKGTVDLLGARCLAPPLGLITIAAMLPKHWDVRLIDRNADEVLTEAAILGVDLVMTGGMLPQEPDTLEIIAMSQRLGVPVCVGGPAPTSTPDIYAAADYLVVGEAEGVIGQFIADWEAGETKGRYDAPKFKADVTTTPIPRFDLIKFHHYAWINIQFSRGCPFTCEFCDIIELYGRAPRTKTAPQLLAELDRLYALGYRGHLDFVDDNLIGNKKAIKKFLPQLKAWQEAKGYPFKLSTEASMNLADDPELLGMMRDANFFALFTGIETPDEATLVQMQKKQNTRRSIADSVHRIYEAGMYVVAGFVVGFDAEEKSVSGKMMDCIRATAIPTTTVSLLTALPNTQLSRRLAKEGRVFDGFRSTMTESGDMCTAGLNFVTARPRREILTDYRDVVGTAYNPTEFFYRVRTMGEKLRPAKIAGRKLFVREKVREIVAFVRLAWIMSVTHPELRWHFWFTLNFILRKNRTAIEPVVRNISHYVYLYTFAKYLVRTVDARIDEIDAGKWDALEAHAPAPARVLEAVAAVA